METMHIILSTCNINSFLFRLSVKVLNKEVDETIELARLGLGINKSSFLNFCIMSFLYEKQKQ